ncbi:hypothetical protein [Fibrella aquatica]|jgi:hypothetical protein|uniref:hypothetical protein n=1 Tax=Fibrella aquatica TaxID=3242487 RepID=UPI003521FB18
MKNPFPALIAYILIQTVLIYPVATSAVVGVIMLVGWAMALNELFSLESSDELPEVA